MDLRPLVEVDLREALGPINRGHSGQLGQAGQFAPAVRTPAQLRERAAAGVLDLSLSRACYLSGALVGACLIDHVGENAHIEAIGVDPLAQQRGAGRALVETICTAAAAAGVKHLSAYASDFDNIILGALNAAGFTRRRDIARYQLQGAPAALTQPRDLGKDAIPDGTTGQVARAVPIAEALLVLAPDAVAGRLLFDQQAAVLSKLAEKGERIVAYVTLEAQEKAPHAAAIFDRDRKLLLALGGDNDKLAPLLCLVSSRFGVALLDALASGHPAEAAVTAAGFVRMAVRAEWIKDL